MELLKVEDLCKVYGRGENRVAALDHVSLSVEQGDFIAIVGSSGSGKSTLLHAIAGVDIPTSGRVLLNGQDVYACLLYTSMVWVLEIPSSAQWYGSLATEFREASRPFCSAP